MADPVTITLGSLGAVALAEGIKFLYGQAGDLIRRWRDRREKKQEVSGERASVSLPEDVFEGQLRDPVIDFEALDAATKELSRIRQDLTPYVDGIEEVRPGDQDLLTRVDALRTLLEAVYRQRITFKGESRPASGTVVEAKIDIDEVAGDAAAVRARELRSGTVRAEARAKKVAPGGKLTGADIDRIGPDPE